MKDGGGERESLGTSRLPVVGAALLAALPAILSTAHSLSVGWRPVGDDAVIAARSYDVLSTHSPLLGQYSAASEVLGDATYSLGPLLYWLLALPARLGGAPAMVVTIGLMNAAAAAGVALVARRRAGTALMFVAAGAVAVASASLVGHTLSDIWNPAAGIMPLALLAVVAWSIGCGDHRLLPLAALLASFVTQCHLTYLPATLALLLPAAAGLIVTRRRTTTSEPLRRWLLLSAAVLAVCWAAPLIDQAVHRPGNLVLLARTAVAGEPTVGAESGARAPARAVGVPPWWLHSSESGADRLEDMARAPGTLTWITAAAVIAALAGVLGVAIVRRRVAVAVAAAQALALGAALGSVAAATPSKGLLPLALAYSLWWGSIAGAFAWVTLGCGAAALAGRPRLQGGRPLAGVVAAAVVAGVVAVALAGRGEDVLETRYEPMRKLEQRLVAEVPEDSRVLVESELNSGFDTQFDYAMGSVYVLRRHGAEVRSQPSTALGAQYRPGGDVDWIVRVRSTAGPPPAGARTLARIATGRPGEFVLVTLAPPGGAASR